MRNTETFLRVYNSTGDLGYSEALRALEETPVDDEELRRRAAGVHTEPRRYYCHAMTCMRGNPSHPYGAAALRRAIEIGRSADHWRGGDETGSTTIALQEYETYPHRVVMMSDVWRADLMLNDRICTEEIESVSNEFHAGLKAKRWPRMNGQDRELSSTLLTRWGLLGERNELARKSFKAYRGKRNNRERDFLFALISGTEIEFDSLFRFVEDARRVDNPQFALGYLDEFVAVMSRRGPPKAKEYFGQSPSDWLAYLAQ